MIGKMSGMFEHTVVFVFFLFLLILGLIMASRLVGAYVQPTSASLGTALQAA